MQEVTSHGSGKRLLGFAGLGVDIYVPASRPEEAQDLLTAESKSEEL